MWGIGLTRIKISIYYILFHLFIKSLHIQPCDVKHKTRYFFNMTSVLLSSAESRCASPTQRLLSRPDMQSEARKKYTTSTLIDQKDSSRHKSSKRNKKLDITGHFSISTFF